MANTLLTAQTIARQALANLYETTVAAQLVHRDFEDDFASGTGATARVRKPAVFQAKDFDRAKGVELQDANEGYVDVTLDHLADVSFAVTAEEMALSITDFDAQFLTPAMEAIVQKVDRDIIAALNTAVTTTIGGVEAHEAGEDYNGYNGAFPASDSRVLVEAAAALDGAKVPFTDRRTIAGRTIKAAWAAERTWRSADRAGSTEGLREASIGRASGFDVFMSQNETADQALAFHRTACALVSRPLDLPRGAANAAVENYEGLSIRVVYGYDMDRKEDRISIDCLYGVKVLDPARAVKIAPAVE